MKVSELADKLGLFVDYNKSDSKPDEEITFYFLKDNILTNCQLEDINSYGMGIEFTVQDTSEVLEESEL